MMKNNIILKKLLPLFLALALILTMSDINVKAEVVAEENPVIYVDNTTGEGLDLQNNAGDAGMSTTEELHQVTIKVELLKKSNDSLLKEDTSFDVYAKADKKFEESLGTVFVMEGKGEAELFLDPGTYVLQQTDEIENYADAKDKEFKVKEETDKKEFEISLAKASATTEKKSTTSDDPVAAEDPEKTENEEEESYSEIPVSVEWCASEKNIPESLDVKLLCDGAVVDETTLNAAGSWQDKFIHGPFLKRTNGQDCEYKIEFQNLDATLYKEVSVTSAPNAGFASKMISTEKLGNFKVSAQLGEGEEIPLDSVEVMIKRTDVEDDSKDEETVEPFKLTPDGEWKKSFNNNEWPLYDQETGHEYTYYLDINDDKIPGYTTEYDPELPGDDSENKIITLVPKEEPEAMKTVTVKAVLPEGANIEPSAILTVDGKEVETISLSANEVESIEVSKSATVKFLRGDDTEGYVCKVTHKDNDWTLTYMKQEAVPIVVKVTGLSDQKVKVTVKKPGQKSETKEFKADNWRQNFSGDKYDANGNEITYNEKNITSEAIDGFTYTVSGTVKDGFVVAYTANSNDPAATTTEATTAAGTTAATTKSAKTGDDNHVLEYAGLLAVAAVGLMLLGVYRKKRIR